MANREENLKKINAELEQLSDEELEEVAGGTYKEIADDKELIMKEFPKKELINKYGVLLPDWLPEA